MSTPPRVASVADRQPRQARSPSKVVQALLPFSPRSRRSGRSRPEQSRPLSTAALLDSADDGDDGDDEDQEEGAAVAGCTSPPPCHVNKPKARAKRKQGQQGPKFSDSGGDAGVASEHRERRELVLNANSILEGLSGGTKASDDAGDHDAKEKQEAESWRFRRRKGSASLDAALSSHGGEVSRSYHRDCQEALQSLLWEPYDCRDPKDRPVYKYPDDVSLWLYPRSGPGRRVPRAEGCRCSISPADSSNSGCSSSEDDVPRSGPGPGAPVRETSASSLRGLLTASTSGGSSAAEGGAGVWACQALPARTAVHGLRRRRHHQVHHRDLHRDPHRVVTDLKTPWIGTQLLSLRGAPPAALPAVPAVPSPSCSTAIPTTTTTTAVAACAPCGTPSARQSETVRAGRRTLTPSRTSYGHRCPTMLVNVSEELPACSVSASVSTSSGTCVVPVPVQSSAVWSCASASVSSVSVPSPSVSAVPTIPCLNNVSNVHVGSPTPRPRPRPAVTPSPSAGPAGVPPPPQTSPRTFASTEAQTDDLEAESRRERRRERRERRHLRRLQPRHPHPHPAPPPPTGPGGPGAQTTVPEAAAAGLPDILHSHLPPPYTTLPLGLPPHILAAPVPPPLVAAPPPQLSPGHHRFAAPGLRLPFAFVPATRRRSGRGPAYSADEEPKSCCGVLVGQPVSIRWFILLILLVGLCCAVVGTVLGAMKASGREHLTVSLLMIGVGIVLVTVSGVAWRLTSHDAPSCRVMLGMASGDEGAAEPNRRFVPRLPPSYGRPHHPYAAMMYPEFQYRPPPPSYQASMQEYRLRLLLLDRHPGGGALGGALGGSLANAAHAAQSAVQNGVQGTVSPPPTYRSHAGSLLRAPLGCRREVAASEYSRPPSYRSRSSSTRPSLEPGGSAGLGLASSLAGSLAGGLAGALAGALGGLHSRTASVATDHSLSDAGTCPPQPVSVISVGGSGRAGLQLDSVKCVPDQEVYTMAEDDPAGSTLQMMLRKSDNGSQTKDANLVTIVQTSSTGSAVSTPISHPLTSQDPSSPVIVTVSGSLTAPVCSENTEMEILAHL